MPTQTLETDWERIPTPSPSIAGTIPYEGPNVVASVDLCLDSNEGQAPDSAILNELADVGIEMVRRYPSARALEDQIATSIGVPASQVLVTAGGDDALNRACRAFLAPGREIVLPQPTFEMLDRYARLAGADVVSVPWPSGPYPTAAVITAASDRTHVIAVVSPNNPTGAVATSEDLSRLSKAIPHALLLIDLAYGDFAEEDLTRTALGLPNAVVVRSLSKSWGLAGLRVGYAVASVPIIQCLRAAGNPYAVAGPSLALAAAWLSKGREVIRRFVSQVQSERSSLFAILNDLGAQALPSQANFVFARFRDARWVWEALSSLGIAVRSFPGNEQLRDGLRITCPGDAVAFTRLSESLQTVLRPRALLFDLDGVLADVSGSYRQAIVDTAASFGIELRPGEVAAAKAEGDCNNDWKLTQRLLARRGCDVDLPRVVERFEAIYQGAHGTRGLRERERLLVDHRLLCGLAKRLPLAVVTGRPRADAERFLRSHGIQDLFATVVCMEDAPEKPSPAPVQLALARLGVAHAWMIGDTPDDIRAARAAGILPIGITAPEDEAGGAADAMKEMGASRILRSLTELEELLS